MFASANLFHVLSPRSWCGFARRSIPCWRMQNLKATISVFGLALKS